MSAASFQKKLTKRNSASDEAVEPVNFGQLLTQLGDIPPERVRLNPPPGQATKEDLMRLLDRDKILSELVDGTLV